MRSPDISIKDFHPNENNSMQYFNYLRNIWGLQGIQLVSHMQPPQQPATLRQSTVAMAPTPSPAQAVQSWMCKKDGSDAHTRTVHTRSVSAETHTWMDTSQMCHCTVVLWRVVLLRTASPEAGRCQLWRECRRLGLPMSMQGWSKEEQLPCPVQHGQPFSLLCNKSQNVRLPPATVSSQSARRSWFLKQVLQDWLQQSWAVKAASIPAMKITEGPDEKKRKTVLLHSTWKPFWTAHQRLARAIWAFWWAQPLYNEKRAFFRF